LRLASLKNIRNLRWKMTLEGLKDSLEGLSEFTPESVY